MRYTITQFARESVGLCPFRGSYVREFELSHSNPVSRITTINHAHSLLDLLQVDLLASRASLVWPRSGRPRATKSREVDLSRSMGFQLQNVLIPLRLNLLNVCVYLHHRRSKFVYFVRKLSLTMILGESWRAQGAGKKQKFVSISSQYWERRFHNQGILDIRTHFKPTETFQYTHFSSCNPHGVRKGLIKGEALRLLRTNSSAKSFYENIYNFKKRLPARGYLTIS